jgi:hypothetical protein
MIDGIIKALRSYGDDDLRQRLAVDPTLMQALVREYFYCG